MVRRRSYNWKHLKPKQINSKQKNPIRHKLHKIILINQKVVPDFEKGKVVGMIKLMQTMTAL